MQRFPARLFDLGGSGLKTALSLDDSHSLTDIVNLGKCPLASSSSWQSFQEWFLAALPSLQSEIGDGFNFGFSLAGLNKLWENNREVSPSDCRALSVHKRPEDIAACFGLPPERVFVVEDGAAHLLATIYCSEHTPFAEADFPIINFSVGTGVGFGISTETGEIRTEFSMKKKFRNYPMFLNIPSGEDTGLERRTALFKCLTSWQMTNLRDSGKLPQYWARWRRFFAEELMQRHFKRAKWERPRVVCFTGGMAESHVFDELTELDGIRVVLGPANGGLLGALMAIHPEWRYDAFSLELRRQ